MSSLNFLDEPEVSLNTFCNQISDDELYIIEAENGVIICVGDNIPLWDVAQKEHDGSKYWKISLKWL